MSSAPAVGLACRERRANPLWSAEFLERRDGWKRTIPRAVADEFLAYLRAHPKCAEVPDIAALDIEETPRLAEFGRNLRAGLLFGDGVAWIRGLGSLGLSPPEQRLFYLILGSSMGRVMTEYGHLYCVRDRGVDYTKQAVPVSMTRAETGLHTDSSSVDVLPDLVGLLCEEPSKNGGRSLISNALHAYWRLRIYAPKVLEILEEDFIRDLVTPGKDRTTSNVLHNRFPIFSRGRPERGRTFRYMRYWIETGHERAGCPLTARQLGALNVLDEMLTSPENLVGLSLQRGDQLWLNNRTVAHGRERYADSPGNRRQFQRIWVEAPAHAIPRQAGGVPGANFPAQGRARGSALRYSSCVRGPGRFREFFGFPRTGMPYWEEWNWPERSTGTTTARAERLARERPSFWTPMASSPPRQCLRARSSARPTQLEWPGQPAGSSSPRARR